MSIGRAATAEEVQESRSKFTRTGGPKRLWEIESNRFLRRYVKLREVVEGWCSIGNRTGRPAASPGLLMAYKVRSSACPTLSVHP